MTASEGVLCSLEAFLDTALIKELIKLPQVQKHLLAARQILYRYCGAISPKEFNKQDKEKIIIMTSMDGVCSFSFNRLCLNRCI